MANQLCNGLLIEDEILFSLNKKKYKHLTPNMANLIRDMFGVVSPGEKIKCIHLNDSMNPIGSHKDRHANIGYGTIGFDKLINVIYNPRLEGIPFILETPYVNRNESNEYPPYKYEIEMIKEKKFIDFIQ